MPRFFGRSFVMGLGIGLGLLVIVLAANTANQAAENARIAPTLTAISLTTRQAAQAQATAEVLYAPTRAVQLTALNATLTEIDRSRYQPRR